MAWRLSTGFVKALLGGTPSVDNSINASIVCVDGAASDDSITDAANGFVAAGFKADHWLLIIDAAGGANHNILAQVLTVAVGTITFVTGTLTAAGAAQLCIVNFGDGGSVKEILKNGTMDGFVGTRPTDADTTEGASSIIQITKDNAAFVAGDPTNGLNLGYFDGTTLKRGIDPDTTVYEVWRGVGKNSGGTLGWVRWYANAYTTGASSSAIRMDGVVAVSGGDLNMVNGTTITVGVYSEVSSVAMTMTAS